MSCKLKEAGREVLVVVGVLPHLGIVLLDIPAVKVLVKILFNLRKGRLRIIRCPQDALDAVLHILHQGQAQEVELDETIVFQVPEVHALGPRGLELTTHTD